MSIDNLSSEDKARLKQLVDEVYNVLQEVDDLGGLRDTIKSIADEMDIDIKPSVLNKAITIAHKIKTTRIKTRV